MTVAKHLVRAFVLPGCFLLCLSVYGQTPVAGANWLRVQQLPLHTKIRVNADRKGRVCFLDSVDDEHLSCSTGGAAKTPSYTYSRSEIKSIQLTHYVRSTLLGTAIGASAGAVIGFASYEDSTGNTNRGAAAGGGALLFGLIGAVTGAVTDFTRGPTVYRR